jgi:hypothetical protein
VRSWRSPFRRGSGRKSSRRRLIPTGRSTKAGRTEGSRRHQALGSQHDAIRRGRRRFRRDTCAGPRPRGTTVEWPSRPIRLHRRRSTRSVMMERPAAALHIPDGNRRDDGGRSWT